MKKMNLKKITIANAKTTDTKIMGGKPPESIIVSCDTSVTLSRPTERSMRATGDYSVSNSAPIP